MVGLPFSSGLVSIMDNVGPTWLTSVFFGIIMSIIVYKLTGFLSLLCFKGYDKLSKAEQVEWNNRGFSTFHALIVASASFYLLLLSGLFDEGSQDDLIINRNSIVSNSVLGWHDALYSGSGKDKFTHVSDYGYWDRRISVGYFLADMSMILRNFPALGGLEYVLHHGLSMYSIFLSLISGQAQIYILMVLFSEATTPFVNLRWYLDVAGKKSSKMYVCNGVLLFLGWLVARILLFIYFFTHMFIHFDQVKKIFPLGFYSIISVPPLLAVMNLVWFWKIAKGLIKTLSKAKRQ